MTTVSDTEKKVRKTPPTSSSFFDHEERDSKEEKELWSNPTTEQIEFFSSGTLAEGTFEKRGKRMGFWVTRHYMIKDHLLVYKKVVFVSFYNLSQNKGSRKISKVMNMERVRVEYISIEKGKITQRGFRFKKDGQQCEIYSKSEENFAAFRKELERSCIQTNF